MAKTKKKQQPEGRTIGLRIDGELSKALSRRAEKAHESESTVIREILRRELFPSKILQG